MGGNKNGLVLLVLTLAIFISCHKEINKTYISYYLHFLKNITFIYIIIKLFF